MSCRVDADGDCLASYAMQFHDDGVTACGWVYIRTLPGTLGWLLYWMNNSGVMQHGMLFKADGKAYPIDDAFVEGAGATLATGSWQHIASVRARGVHTLYINGVAVSSVAATLDGNINYISIGGNFATEWLDADWAYCRVWGKALNAVQITSEMRSAVAVERTALYADWPMPNGASRAVDVSGRGNNVSEEGAITDGLDYTIRANAQGDNSASHKLAIGVY